MCTHLNRFSRTCAVLLAAEDTGNKTCKPQDILTSSHSHYHFPTLSHCHCVFSCSYTSLRILAKGADACVRSDGERLAKSGESLAGLPCCALLCCGPCQCRQSASCLRHRRLKGAFGERQCNTRFLSKLPRSITKRYKMIFKRESISFSKLQVVSSKARRIARVRSSKICTRRRGSPGHYISWQTRGSFKHSLPARTHLSLSCTINKYLVCRRGEKQKRKSRKIFREGKYLASWQRGSFKRRQDTPLTIMHYQQPVSPEMSPAFSLFYIV